MSALLLAIIVWLQIVTGYVVQTAENSSTCEYVSDLDTFFISKHLAQAVCAIGIIIIWKIWLRTRSPDSKVRGDGVWGGRGGGGRGHINPYLYSHVG